MSNSKKIVIRLIKEVDFRLPYYRLYAGKKFIMGSYVPNRLIFHAFALFLSNEKYILDDKLDSIFGDAYSIVSIKERELYCKLEDSIYRNELTF